VRKLQISSPFSLTLADLKAFPQSSLRKELLRKHGAKNFNNPSNVDLESIPHSVGSGVFTLQSCINHSCVPNVTVIGGLLNTPNSDAQIEVIALRPIKAGEELLMSYLPMGDDPDAKYYASREHRLRYLREAYLFECDCPKCAVVNAVAKDGDDSQSSSRNNKPASKPKKKKKGGKGKKKR